VSKRAYIPLTERLAAALACLLPPTLRDELRKRKVPAFHIISLFNMDHIRLHALERDDPEAEVDLWFNLDPQLSGPHKVKSNADNSRIAKVKRIQKRMTTSRLLLAGVDVQEPERVTRTKFKDMKRKIANRPFPKVKRKLRSRGFR
jgi:hypothetical protein